MQQLEGIRKARKYSSQPVLLTMSRVSENIPLQQPNEDRRHYTKSGTCFQNRPSTIRFTQYAGALQNGI